MCFFKLGRSFVNDLWIVLQVAVDIYIIHEKISQFFSLMDGSKAVPALRQLIIQDPAWCEDTMLGDFAWLQPSLQAAMES